MEVKLRPRRNAKAPDYLTFDFSATSRFADFAHPLNRKRLETELCPMNLFTEESSLKAIASIEGFPSDVSKDVLDPMIEESKRIKYCDGNLGWVTKLCIYGPVGTVHYDHMDRSIDYFYALPSAYRHKNEVELQLLYDAHLIGDDSVLDDYKSAPFVYHGGSAGVTSSSSSCSSTSSNAANAISSNGIGDTVSPLATEETAVIDFNGDSRDFNDQDGNESFEGEEGAAMGDDTPLEADVDINDSSSSSSSSSESSSSDEEDDEDNSIVESAEDAVDDAGTSAFKTGGQLADSESEGDTSNEENSNDARAVVLPVSSSDSSSNEVPNREDGRVDPQLGPVVMAELEGPVRPSSPPASNLVYLDISKTIMPPVEIPAVVPTVTTPKVKSKGGRWGAAAASAASVAPLPDPMAYTAAGTVLTRAPLNPANRVVKVFVTQLRSHNPPQNPSSLLPPALSSRLEPRIGFMMGRLKRASDGYTVYFVEDKKVYRERINPKNLEILTRKPEDQADIEHVRKKISLRYNDAGLSSNP